MASSSEQKPSASRSIPGLSVFEWEPVNGHARKTPTRRPQTACQQCRQAKAKCNGIKPCCARCKGRDIQCIYTPIQQADSGTTEAHHPRGGPAHASSVSNINGDNDSSRSHQDFVSPSHEFGFCDALQDTTDWSEDAFVRALEQFDWTFTDEPSIDPNKIVHNVDGTIHLGVSPSAILGQGEEVDEGGSECTCRLGFMSQIPALEAAMREKPNPRLGRMFRVTDDIINQCSAAANCLDCHLGTVDVVCILTAFQQTAFCFNLIAKSGVNISNHQVYAAKDGEQQLDAVLVMNLVTRASSLLDVLDGHARSLQLAKDTMSRRLTGRSPACLNQLNLSYCQEVIIGFRKLFQIIISVFEGKQTALEKLPSS
ncbi:hypothetical protein PFICI_11660 [Pestalotiopsis fici W106-1]|uniref:Zn(2)-C6 fungal-type domain-containing protein n=1 Tax=Pestalotiopsis fici (strain W106-1 / CGMCC3.15140) TaxID=1229662 RepID=W3WR08_PESFW|nr:uncharacterized protein PFICI_11660 [Pestalotiopsis fici W106-1]ETS76273.1 hypothetical protein PFICI_11660 [Pestalotiopsis fici W106-1]